MARNDRLVMEEFAEYLWFSCSQRDTSAAWISASRQAHGVYMFSTFEGRVSNRESQDLLDDIALMCDARAQLAYAAEIRERIKAETGLDESFARNFSQAAIEAARIAHYQKGNASTFLLAVVACLVLAFGVAEPVARDAISVRVLSCPAPATDPAPAASPAVLTDSI